MVTGAEGRGGEVFERAVKGFVNGTSSDRNVRKKTKNTFEAEQPKKTQT